MTLVETDLEKFPKTWPRKTVGELFDTQLGKMLSQKAHGGGDPKPYLRNKNVQWGTIETSDVLVMDFNEREKEKFRLLPGDLLVCEGGVVGRAALWNGAISECYYQKALHRLRPTNGSVTNEFMLYWLRFAFEIQNFYGVSGASSTIAHLPAAQLRALEVPLPPLPEQKKIAHILSTLQRAIEAQERIIQTTTELKKALMHKLFTEGLRHEPQKQTEIGPVPESWEVKRFDSFAVLQRGFDITKKAQRPGEYPVVSSGGVSSYHDEPKVKGPGVVIGRKGSLGTVHYVPTDYWPHDTTLWVKDFKGNNPRFVAYLIERMRLKRFDTGAANPTLNRNIVLGEKIAIPPKDQQVEIGEALKAVESKIAIHEGRKRSFHDLFRTLLHELMTAKTRVHELELSA